MTTSNVNENKIGKKELRSIFLRSLTLEYSWNYERQQHMGYCFAMLPAIRKIYEEKEAQIEAAKRHMEFFNTTPYISTAVLGISAAMATYEEEPVLPEEQYCHPLHRRWPGAPLPPGRGHLFPVGQPAGQRHPRGPGAGGGPPGGEKEQRQEEGFLLPLFFFAAARPAGRKINSAAVRQNAGGVDRPEIVGTVTGERFRRYIYIGVCAVQQSLSHPAV